MEKYVEVKCKPDTYNGLYTYDAYKVYIREKVLSIVGTHSTHLRPAQSGEKPITCNMIKYEHLKGLPLYDLLLDTLQHDMI